MLIAYSRAFPSSVSSLRFRRLYTYTRLSFSTNKHGRPDLTTNSRNKMSHPPPSTSEGKITATQGDIDARQEEMDAELKEVSRQQVVISLLRYSNLLVSVFLHLSFIWCTRPYNAGAYHSREEDDHARSNSFRVSLQGV
jgi:hypothetical protein